MSLREFLRPRGGDPLLENIRLVESNDEILGGRENLDVDFVGEEPARVRDDPQVCEILRLRIVELVLAGCENENLAQAGARVGELLNGSWEGQYSRLQQ